MKSIFPAFFCSFFILLCFPLSAMAQIKVSGSTTFYNLIFLPLEESVRADYGGDFEVIQTSSGRGVLALHNGIADIGMISSNLDKIITKMQSLGHNIDRDLYEVHPVSQTRTLYITHSSNPLDTLSREQVVQLFTGEITNWADIGGLDQAVRVVTEHETGGIYNTVQKVILDHRPFASDKIVMQNAPRAALVVSQLPGAFGFLSDGTPEEGRHGVKILDAPEAELILPVAFVTRKDDTRPEIQSFIESVRKVAP